MLAWNESTAHNSRKLIDQHPEILQIECDIYGVETVAQALQHIVAIELRYVQRLAGVEETPYEYISVPVR